MPFRLVTEARMIGRTIDSELRLPAPRFPPTTLDGSARSRSPAGVAACGSEAPVT